MGLRDGLGFEEVNQEVTSTAIISGTTIYAGSNIYNSQGALKATKQGTAFGATVQAGSGTLGAGSNAWVAYSTAYTTNALPVATNTKTAAMALFIPAGSLNAGSFYIEGPTAADTFNWISVGI